VHDYGTGIDAKNAERLFEPFITTKPGGMSVGLGATVEFSVQAIAANDVANQR
jgi:C4-dicarboxylate-specific signal transduction histidine kinase